MRVPRSASLALLLAVPLLSGCVQDPVEYEREYKDGFGYVQIWVNQPLGADRYPIDQMLAVPRFVAFVAGDNATELKLGGPGYTDMALGWNPAWLETDPETDEWPAEAQQDWTKRSAIWYEGHVAGEYSVVRVEVIAAWMKFASGDQPPVRVQGERLSVEPAEGETFTVEEGKDLVLAFESKFEAQQYGDFIIR